MREGDKLLFKLIVLMIFASRVLSPSAPPSSLNKSKSKPLQHAGAFFVPTFPQDLKDIRDQQKTRTGKMATNRKNKN